MNKFIAKASYRGHVKFEIVGLKKLIKTGDWKQLSSDVKYFQPLFENGNNDPKVEQTINELASQFKKLDKVASESQQDVGIVTSNVEVATNAYFEIEKLFNDLLMGY